MLTKTFGLAENNYKRLCILCYGHIRRISTYILPNFGRWGNGRSITAATVIDLTDEVTVGKYIMFFHGSSKEGLRAQRAHGAASLALAWSDDLVNWSWPR